MPVDGPQYPVNLMLRGRRVLVVGGGTVARGKVSGLIDGGADAITVIAPEIDDAIVEMGVTCERRSYRSPEAGDYRLVITATDDRAVNHQVFVDGDSAGVWVNSADDPANCGFTLPSRVRQGRLMVTASTGGHGPAVSTWMRRKFEAELGMSFAAWRQRVWETF